VTPSEGIFEEIREEIPKAPTEAYELTLFVSGTSELSSRAISEAKQLCEDHFAGHYNLSIVDVHGDPAALRNSGVLATPTLVKYKPAPIRHLVGDLSHSDWSILSPEVPPGRSARRSTTRTTPEAGSELPHASSDRTGAGKWGRSPQAVDAADADTEQSILHSGVVHRMNEMGEMLRAIGAGEVDGFVVSDDAGVKRVFTLVTADHPFRMFVENMRDGAATVSSDGLILFANQQLANMLLYPREALIGLPLAAFIPGDNPDRSQELLSAGEIGTTTELELLNIDGVAVSVRIGSSPLDLDGDNLTCLTITDLSSQKAQDREIAMLGLAQAEQLVNLRVAQAALVEQATHDALTRLPNRAVLVDRIGQALIQATRSDRCTAVLFVDLDEFKHVNDVQGHAAGDALLRNVAERLRRSVRSMDTVARIGGDEFVVLAPGVDTEVHAVEIGNQLLGALAQPRDAGEEGVGIAASIGIAVSVGGRGTAEILLQEADDAMYQAKALGKGRVELFDGALRLQIEERASAQRSLQSALDEKRIIAYYQPIVDLSHGSVAGFEALVRMVDHDGSIKPPAAFLPIAEDSGLVVPLGSQVLDMACRSPGTWDPSGQARRPLSVAVNVSGRQFESGELPSIVQAVLRQTELAPEQLHLELIETTIIDLHPDILKQLGLIRDLGVEIGLDDFGTGYASLTHLRQLPLTFVKIDRSFVEGIGTDSEDEGIVSAVIDLAAHLGLRSIAEGIETPHQLDRLRQLGCDQAQGFLFAKPMASSDAAKYGPPAIPLW
jgi:diguanylate cyclase (GGDEF)-like protein/PAS domain S-box-containing protein